jgi:hypothetical protein
MTVSVDPSWAPRSPISYTDAKSRVFSTYTAVLTQLQPLASPHLNHLTLFIQQHHPFVAVWLGVLLVLSLLPLLTWVGVGLVGVVLGVMTWLSVGVMGAMTLVWVSGVVALWLYAGLELGKRAYSLIN